MNSHTQILKDLTDASRSIKSPALKNRGIARTPNFTAPSVRSSRPSSDRGVTFHFAHKTISKTKDFSANTHGSTAASSHQEYIERLSATEKSTKDIIDALHFKDPDIAHDIKLAGPSLQLP